ncbi:MAG: amino acid permease [Acidobacteriia bacterium]|nr:amino acid permease [Terriglobia bacterium]
MSRPSEKLIRGLTLVDASSIVIGTVIGTGIFIVPAYMAQAVRTPLLVFAVWIVAGLLSLAGALTYAELGAAFPAAGGEYVYIREAYGSLFGFMYGWTYFLVGKTGSLATLATGFALYFADLHPLSRVYFRYQYSFFGHPAALTLSDQVLMAIGVIAFLSLVNVFGVVTGGRLQSFLTALKVGTLLLIVALALILGHGTISNFSTHLTPVAQAGLISLFGVAMIKALWAYDGWNNCNMVAGEVRNPQRNIPLSLIYGTGGVMLLYLLVNFAYFYVLPIDRVAASPRVAADVAKTFLGSMGGKFVVVAVLISTFAAINGSILSGARIYFAMAEDRLFFAKVASVHPRFRTPVFSILLQAIWASLLTLTGTYDQLLTYVIFAEWILYGLGTASVFVLRKKYPHIERPYRTWGYPVVPLLFVFAAVLLLGNVLVTDTKDSLMGLFLIVLGLPAYGLWRRKALATGNAGD